MTELRFCASARRRLGAGRFSAALGRLRPRDGNAEALAWRPEAMVILQFIDAHTRDDLLRERFLNVPHVQEALRNLCLKDPNRPPEQGQTGEAFVSLALWDDGLLTA